MLRSNGQKGPLLTTTRWCRPLLTIGRGEQLPATNQWSSCGQTYSYLALVLALHLSLLPHVLFLQSYKKHMLVETDTFSFHAGHGWVTKNPSNCFLWWRKTEWKAKEWHFHCKLLQCKIVGSLHSWKGWKVVFNTFKGSKSVKYHNIEY